MQGIDLIFGIAILVMSVVAHEVSHGYMAYYLGDPTAKLAGRLTLNPLNHLDPFGSVIFPILTRLLTGGQMMFGWAKPVPYNPYNLQAGKWGPAMVAAAGPAANLLIAAFFGSLIRFGVAPSISVAFIDITMQVTLVNIVLAVFNLIPIPPLDGSGILFSVLPYSMRGVREFIEQYQLFLIVFVVFYLWSFVTPVVFLLFKLFTGVPIG